MVFGRDGCMPSLYNKQIYEFMCDVPIKGSFFNFIHVFLCNTDFLFQYRTHYGVLYPYGNTHGGG